MKHGMHGAGNPAMGIGGRSYFINKAGNVLPCGHAGDGPGKNVIKHQRRDAEFCQRSAQGFFHHAVDAAAREHGTALDVYRAHRERKEHYSQDEPGRSLPHRLFGNAAGIKRRRTQIIENNGRRTPI